MDYSPNDYYFDGNVCKEIVLSWNQDGKEILRTMQELSLGACDNNIDCLEFLNYYK